MAKDWKARGVEEKLDWLHDAIESLEKAVGATQDDVSSLSQRFVEMDLQQKSTFELVTELTATVERTEGAE
ncbi:hypothetical protein [Rhodoblastus sp.]|uniref:hypothetical protein n=1 Tax=Rhodoblastus sp. TaxID=1962975 RepID=UPI003F97F5D8